MTDDSSLKMPTPSIADKQGHSPWQPHYHNPPPYTPPVPPASGFRIALTSGDTFPTAHHSKEPPCRDLDGSPVYLGSALFDGSVHPCKIAPHIPSPCRVPYGGREHEHHGRYDLLPFDRATMEFVGTSHGHIPAGRRPVDGGYEDGGQSKLYHAVATVISGGQEVRVPGKTGVHLVRLS
jgi:hypothetical protein